MFSPVKALNLHNLCAEGYREKIGLTREKNRVQQIKNRNRNIITFLFSLFVYEYYESTILIKTLGLTRSLSVIYTENNGFDNFRIFY